MAKVGRASRNASLLRVEGTITANKTIQPAESGELYFIDASAASTNFTLTLPAAKAGVYLTFVLVAASHSASEVMLDAGSGSTIKGLAMSATDVAQAAISNQRLKFPDSAAIGSRVSLVCDGTNWLIVEALASVAFTVGTF
jgi:hypothetical protein